MVIETTDSLVEQRLEGAHIGKEVLFGEQTVWLAWPSRDAEKKRLATVAESLRRNFTMLWRSSDTPCGAHAQSSDCGCRATAMLIGKAERATSKPEVGQHRAQRSR